MDAWLVAGAFAVGAVVALLPDPSRPGSLAFASVENRRVKAPRAAKASDREDHR